MDTPAAVEHARAEQPAAARSGPAASFGAGFAPGLASGRATAVASSPIVALGGLAMPILELQRLAGNRAVASALAGVQRSPAEETPAPVPATDATNAGSTDVDAAPPKPAPRMTGYVGMNPDATKEVRALEKSAGKDSVLATLGDATLEAKLKEEPALFDFVIDDLGISVAKVDRWTKAIDALALAGPSARDTLGQLMRWMSRAEKGEIVLDRLVLSGHSNGFELWGTPESPNAAQKPGTLMIEQDLANVAAVFPAAAGQVRSIMFSACETVGAVETVLRIFPNLESVWAYAGFSPSIAQGSGQHIEAWEGATDEGGAPTKKDAKGATAIWTRKDKWLVKDPGKGNVQTLYTQAMGLYLGPVANMLRGEREISLSELASIYGKVQELVQHPAITDAQKLQARNAMETVLRLRHWPPIRRRFAAEYGPKLVEPYRKLGLTPPEWESITRAGVVKEIRRLEKAWDEHKDAAAAIEETDRLVYQGLGQLNAKVIPAEWNE